jgi:hypothetical protein
MMTGGGDALTAAAVVVDAFERLGVRYHVGGSIAGSAHGVPRSTLDVDLVADLREQHIEPLVLAIGDAFHADESAMRDAVRRRDAFNLIHLDTLVRIDVFVAGTARFDRAEMERAIPRSVADPARPDRAFWIKSPEDLVIRKLLWFRISGERSDRQWRDVVGLLRVQSDRLDRDYLAVWMVELDLADLFTRAAAEAGFDRV